MKKISINELNILRFSLGYVLEYHRTAEEWL